MAFDNTLNSTNLFANNAPAAQQSNGAAAKPKSKLWANIGFVTQVQNDEGVTEERFVSLPFGLAIDTMNNTEVQRKDNMYKTLQIAENDLLESLKKLGLSMEPGQQTIIADLKVQIHRVDDREQAPTQRINVPTFGA